MGRVKAKAMTKGKGYSKVWHPNPEANVIEAEWPIAVHVGEMTL